ncbi:mycofactocin-coupled SDR family oxidoreductase [Frankia tisae]|uniref:mycofactocin-coupled SDR family oxidoreductase n=1 Tax=Frankia tisae TaxID=2950104 RepID=UPI0021C1BBBC|nr:mycofactocin-coupled SDR family oxidoreductase [Frankia tisae]
MSSDLSGKVAFITGIARGQGRAHALRLARDGAAIIGVDICADIPSMSYPNASRADLDETQKLVEAEGGQILTRVADVRDQAALRTVFDEGLTELGRIDIVIANAGIIRFTEDDPVAEWHDIIDVNLTGVWNACRVAIPALVEGGRGGSIVITSSTAGLKGTGTDAAGGQAYAAAKRGLVGLMQVFANDLAPHNIRVNTIHPTGVSTGMLNNQAFLDFVATNTAGLAAMQNALPVEILQADDIAEVVAWLVSDSARYLTGVQLPVDAGFAVR